jgi:hypothetical protein
MYWYLCVWKCKTMLLCIYLHKRQVFIAANTHAHTDIILYGRLRLYIAVCVIMQRVQDWLQLNSTHKHTHTHKTHSDLMLSYAMNSTWPHGPMSTDSIHLNHGMKWKRTERQQQHTAAWLSFTLIHPAKYIFSYKNNK